MIRPIFVLIMGTCLAVMPAAAKTLLEQGEDLFMQNKPGAAVSLLENALNQAPNNPKVYLYLGICYEQLGQHQKAIEILSRGASLPGANVSLFYYDVGNNYFALKDLKNAEAMYTKAIQLGGSFVPPNLNRANLRVQTKQYKSAVNDYTVYLNLNPSDPQAPTIQKMIALLSNQITSEEQRVAAEKQKQAEAEAKRKAILDSVLNSLNNASSDTKNMSGGNAQIENKTEPLDIAP